MFFRILLFLLLFYLLVRVIGRLFMPAGNSGRSNTRQRSNRNPFYEAFRQQQQSNNQRRKGIKEKLDEIEDAEFEDITEEETKSK